MPVRIQEPETKCETTQEKPVEKQEKTDENSSPPKDCTEPIEQKTSTCKTSGEKASQSWLLKDIHSVNEARKYHETRNGMKIDDCYFTTKPQKKSHFSAHYTLLHFIS